MNDIVIHIKEDVCKIVCNEENARDVITKNPNGESVEAPAGVWQLTYDLDQVQRLSSIIKPKR